MPVVPPFGMEIDLSRPSLLPAVFAKQRRPPALVRVSRLQGRGARGATPPHAGRAMAHACACLVSPPSRQHARSAPGRTATLAGD
eukprot:2994249-Prymnesium_polylepis.1